MPASGADEAAVPVAATFAIAAASSPYGTASAATARPAARRSGTSTARASDAPARCSTTAASTVSPSGMPRTWPAGTVSPPPWASSQASAAARIASVPVEPGPASATQATSTTAASVASPDSAAAAATRLPCSTTDGRTAGGRRPCTGSPPHVRHGDPLLHRTAPGQGRRAEQRRGQPCGL